MNVPTTRTCHTCGAVLAAGAPCAACAMASALVTLGFDQKPSGPSARFSPLDLPSTFGPYRVQRKIAAGGMGMVYEAEDTRLGRPVALKMLRQVLFASDLDRARFQSEAELASQLDHPHIVPIHDVGEIEGQPYFTMKIIRGGSLAERLENGALPARECAALMVKVARAVHHAHQRGLMHRDLKPANVLIDEAGEPWLTDFGLAKLLDTDSGMTLTNAVAGTPHYMSPEQAAGKKDEISTATDVWALGVIFYQMLTDRLPFYSASNSEILRLVAEKEPPAPSAIIHRLDRDLETLCLRCLEKNPARRLASAGDLADELERWLRGEPIRARRITGWERTGKWMRRHPFRASLLGTLALVVVTAAVAVTWQWRRATDNERLALANESRALANEHKALFNAEVERRTAYSATLASALAARENHDLGRARRLLDAIDPDHRGFDWRLLHGLCRGDERHAYRLGSGPGAEPQCLAMMPGGEQLAILTADGYLHLRDAKGEEVAAPRALPPIPDERQKSHRFYRLTFSPDGKRLAYAKGDVLQVLESESLTLLHEVTSVRPQFDWLDDHRLLYGFNGSVEPPPWPKAGAWILDFQHVDSPTGEVRTTSFPAMCAPLAVSADRRFFVLHCADTSAWSWARNLHLYRADGDLAAVPKSIYALPGNEYPGELTLSRSGRYLAFSAGAKLKRSARVLDLSTGEMVFDYEFRFPIHGLAIGLHERRLGLVGGDSVVRVYDFTRGKPEPENTNTYDDEVPFARCQQVTARGAQDPPREFLSRSAQDGRARFFLGHEQRVMDLVFDSSGSFTTASSDGTLRRWSDDIPRSALRLGHMIASYDLYHPAASASGRHVLLFRVTSELCDVAASQAGGHDVTCRIKPTQRHMPLAVFGDGRPVALDSRTAEVVTWRMEGGSWREESRITEHVPFQHDARLRRGVLSHDETRLLGVLAGRLFTVDFEHQSLTWGSELGSRATVHANHDLSPDGEWIASSDFGPRVTIHRFAEPDQIVARLDGGSRDYDTAVVFSRDGRRLYTGNEDGRIRVWDTATWNELPELGWLAHRSAVTALSVSHEGSLIASSGGDTLKLFPIDPEPGESYRRERLSFPLEQAANWLQFARDENGQDSALLHSAPGRTLEIWEGCLARSEELAAPRVNIDSLPIDLHSYGAVALRDGKVLIVGGFAIIDPPAAVALSDCYLFDPVSNSLSRTGSLRSPRALRQELTLLPNGKVLVAGGTGREGGSLASCELYDPATGIWSSTGSLAQPRFGGARLLLKTGRVLAVGDSGDNLVRIANCELYDPETGTWSATEDLSTGRGGGCYAFLSNGLVLAAGGRDAQGIYLASELYDPESGVWKPTGANTIERQFAFTIPLSGGEALLLGGRTPQGPSASCGRYDPVTGAWRTAADLPNATANLSNGHLIAILLPSGKVLVTGGNSAGPSEDGPPGAAAHLYDPENDTWSEAPDHHLPPWVQTATPLGNGKALLVGGRNGDGAARRVEVLDASGIEP